MADTSLKIVAGFPFTRYTVTVWVKRLLNTLRAEPGPLIISGGDAYGVPYLIDALSNKQRVVWFELTRNAARDPVAINNLLAEAANRTFGRKIFREAVPYALNLESLKRYVQASRTLYIACGNAELNPDFRADLLSLQGVGIKVILLEPSPTLALPEGRTLSPRDLALTDTEAAEIAGPFLGASEQEMLLTSAGRAYTVFHHAVLRLANLPIPIVPSPTESKAAPGEQLLVDPDALLKAFLELKRYTDALELAALSLPEHVPEIIGLAGPEFQAQGTLSRLHILLESLDEAYQNDLRVLEWRLVAAFHENDHARLFPLVEQQLRTTEAPNLRARYAGLLHSPENRIAEANRAAAAEPNPLTLYQLGRLQPDEHQAVVTLKKAVQLAEQQGTPYEIVRNSAALARSYLRLGHIQEAASWNKWSQITFDRYNLNNGTVAVGLLITQLSTRLLLGDLDGLDEQLTSATELLESANMQGRLDFRMVYGNYLIVIGNPERAQEILEPAYALNPRQLVGEYTVPLVRALLEQGLTREAIHYAEQAVALLHDESPYYALPAALALGMAYSDVKPDVAQNLLQKVLAEPTLEAHLRIPAALYLLKLEALRLSDLEPHLLDRLLSLTPVAFHLYSGHPDRFENVRWELAKQNNVLSITALGQPKVVFQGEQLRLKGRQLEALILLALHPKGIYPEMLHTQLYNDESLTLISLRSVVSRLRSIIPISESPEPYKLLVPLKFDVEDCIAALATGQIRKALELYQGPLCPQSDAPGIRDARESLGERLKQRVLQSNDLRLLFLLTEKFPDDIELWEYLHDALPRSDDRASFVTAELKRTQRSLLS